MNFLKSFYKQIITTLKHRTNMTFYIISIYLMNKYNHNQMIIIITTKSNHKNNTSSGLFNISILLFI